MKTLTYLVMLVVIFLPHLSNATTTEPTWKQTYLLAINLDKQEDWGSALTAAKLALRKAKSSFGRSSLNASKSHMLLAELYAQRGKYASAEIHYAKVIRIRGELFGPDHVSMTEPLTLLAELYATRNKFDLAQQFFTKAIHSGQGDKDPATARALEGLASLRAREGRYEESAELLHRAIEICDSSKKYGEPICGVASRSLIVLAEVYMSQGKFLPAAKAYRKALELLESQKGPDGLVMYSVLTRLGDAYQNAGSRTLADNYHRRAASIYARELGSTRLAVQFPHNPSRP